MTDWKTADHDPENCPGCRPVIFDYETRKALPPDHPIQKAADQAWRDAVPAQRLAWHRVTCLNSTNRTDQLMASVIVAAIHKATSK